MTKAEEYIISNLGEDWNIYNDRLIPEYMQEYSDIQNKELIDRVKELENEIIELIEKSLPADKYMDGLLRKYNADKSIEG